MRGANTFGHSGQLGQLGQPPPPTIHNCYEAEDGFKHLQAHVATSAFDSEQTVDAPKCHPNTRIAVLDEIMEWIQLTVTRVQWMLWLNGAAGAGKSAIARSIVALCLERNIPIARFFFFRTDPTRNNIKPIVATLVHQLIQQLPDLLPIVVPKIQSDPLIFSKSLETQLAYLVFEPLRQLHHEYPFKNAVVLLFDGVDECSGDENQTNLIRLIFNFLSNRDLPVIAFFGSRPEYQLQQVFRSSDIATSLLQLALDDHYLPDADIHLFLDDKFTQIKETHSFSQSLPKEWPDPEHVKEIVNKSSGQFIYASVVIHFIFSPRQHPAQQLEIIRGLRPVGKLTPFAQLDALYQYIFSQVEDIDHASLILAYSIFGDTVADPTIEDFLGLNSDDLYVLLADLPSILIYKDGNVHFLHASLPDFLLDSTRSQAYYLDKKLWCTRISIQCFQRLPAGIVDAFVCLTYEFLQYAEGTVELRDHVLTFAFDLIPDFSYDGLSRYLTSIQDVDFGDNGELYRGQLNRVVRHVLEHPHVHEPDIISKIKENHNISAVLPQIESEKGGDLPLQQADEAAHDFTDIVPGHIPCDDIGNTQVVAVSLAASVADEGVVARYIEPETHQPVTVPDKQAKRTLRPRRLVLKPKENTTMLSNQPTTQPEVVIPPIERDMPPPKSRFGWIAIFFCLFIIVLFYFQVLPHP